MAGQVVMINAAVILRPLRGPTHSEVSIRASVAAWLPTACCLVELQTKVREDFTIKEKAPTRATTFKTQIKIKTLC